MKLLISLLILVSVAIYFSRNTFQTHKPFDYIIENQRVRIDHEMDQFPFENNQELMDLIPDQGGRPIRAMVI